VRVRSRGGCIDPRLCWIRRILAGAMTATWHGSRITAWFARSGAMAVTRRGFLQGFRPIEMMSRYLVTVNRPSPPQ
jgi:hypothetical protein